MPAWRRDAEDDRPLTDEEFLEMRAAFEAEVKRLADSGYSIFTDKRPIVPMKCTRRQLRYLEKLEELKGEDWSFGDLSSRGKP